MRAALILGMWGGIMMGNDVKIRLRHLIEDTDRHGNVRCYLRLPGRPKVRVRGMPGTEEFMVNYHAAVSTASDTPRQARVAARGSFRFLCQGYFASATFKALDTSTRLWRRRALEAICAQHAEKPVALMQPRHVRQLRDDLAESPGAANTRLKALRALFRWAVEAEAAPHDPTRDVHLIRYASKGFHCGRSKRLLPSSEGIRSARRPDWRWRYCCTPQAGERTRCGSGRSICTADALSIGKPKTSTATPLKWTFRCIPTCRQSLRPRGRAI
jgi:hypothetical protein